MRLMRPDPAAALEAPTPKTALNDFHPGAAF